MLVGGQKPVPEATGNSPDEKMDTESTNGVELCRVFLKRLQNTSYSAQAQKLEETKSNLQTLLQFIEEERKKLALSEQAVSSLKREYDRIRPLIESDRKTINSILATQEARNQVAQITERWIGFGVASSLLA